MSSSKRSYINIFAVMMYRDKWFCMVLNNLVVKGKDRLQICLFGWQSAATPSPAARPGYFFHLPGQNLFFPGLFFSVDFFCSFFPPTGKKATNTAKILLKHDVKVCSGWCRRHKRSAMFWSSQKKMAGFRVDLSSASLMKMHLADRKSMSAMSTWPDLKWLC